MSPKALRDMLITGAERRKGTIHQLGLSRLEKLSVLEKAGASRVVSSTMAQGGVVAKGPGGSKEREVTTLRSHLGREQPLPALSPQPSLSTRLKPSDHF